ncbi:hypothetical protein PR048_019562 [Dryococelus australis]|uniref:Uncharacterized protein n=1 Tax=Dryococelus australis TaxID=614101 RepID=A0ABQ9H3S9_9NEOP|nr:hypothetical protein PR048_019562 [Dryococelus australis]
MIWHYTTGHQGHPISLPVIFFLVGSSVYMPPIPKTMDEFRNRITTVVSGCSNTRYALTGKQPVFDLKRSEYRKARCQLKQTTICICVIRVPYSVTQFCDAKVIILIAHARPSIIHGPADWTTPSSRITGARDYVRPRPHQGGPCGFNSSTLLLTYEVVSCHTLSLEGPYILLLNCIQLQPNLALNYMFIMSGTDWLDLASVHSRDLLLTEVA